MNLGELKAIVDTWTAESFCFTWSFEGPHSYRGYYNEVAFSGTDTPRAVWLIKDDLKRAMTDTFTGWKGGEFVYDDTTPVYLSSRGSSNDEDGHDFAELVFAMDREYRSFNSNPCYNTSMETNTETKMPTKRKTAAEKRAEAESLRLQEQQEEEANFRAGYQTRLLRMVGLFHKHEPLRVTFEDDEFAFDADMNGYLHLPLSVIAVVDIRAIMDDLDTVERWFDRYVQELEEARAKAAKKTAALAKLTKEERELLGL